MKITLDRPNNAAYIYLTEIIPPGSVASTYACDPSAINGIINLDFDSQGRLLGIEILDATSKLSDDALKNAMIIG